jgi:tyrosine-protein kinase Etk/Wzc
MHSSDISRVTKVPVLGEIVYEEGAQPIAVNSNSPKAIAEQFRTIRTNYSLIYGKTNAGNGHVTLLLLVCQERGKVL